MSKNKNYNLHEIKYYEKYEITKNQYYYNKMMTVTR